MDNASVTPIGIAENLLQAVKCMYGSNNPQSPGDEAASFDDKKRIQQLCLSLLEEVAGPSEYTILLAGMSLILLNATHIDSSA